MADNLWWKTTSNLNTTFNWRRPSIEEDFCGRQPLMVRQPLMEDNLWCKTTFDVRQILMKEDLWWKTTFLEYDLWWKTAFNGRQLLMEGDLQWYLTLKIRGWKHSLRTGGFLNWSLPLKTMFCLISVWKIISVDNFCFMNWNLKMQGNFWKLRFLF